MDKENIEKYLIEECNIKEPNIEHFVQKITKYEDIGTEFYRWLQNREFSAIFKVEGYSAKDIYEMAPFMKGIGVYNFLVDLRDDPEQAKKIIDDGFAMM